MASHYLSDGKQGGFTLRDMENKIIKDLDDKLLVYETRNLTLNAFYEQYIELKHELKYSTRQITSICITALSVPISGRRT